MDETSYELSVIAFYISKFNEYAINDLGFKNKSEALKKISIIMGRPNNYLKMRGDEFDPLLPNPRKGFRNRKVAKDVERLFNELDALTFNELSNNVKSIIRRKIQEHEKNQIESEDEAKYVLDVNDVVKSYVGKKKILHHPKAVKARRASTSESFVRNKNIALNALCNANYKCEINSKHKTFVRKSGDIPYTEPHHLVPMSAQSKFNVSLDVENNIVSLCSNCHNHLHYGKDIELLLKLLYKKRKKMLEMAGIKITYEELLELYR